MSGTVDSWPALSFLEGLRPGPDENVELALLASYSADLGSIGATLLALAGKDTDAGRGSPSDFADAVERLRGKVCAPSSSRSRGSHGSPGEFGSIFIGPVR